MDISHLSSDKLADMLWTDRVVQTIGDRFVLASPFTVENIGERFAIEAQPPGYVGYPSSALWDAFKEEMRLFICTDDRKYVDLRKVFGNTKSQAAAVSAVAVAVGSSVGGPLAAVTALPFCALILYAVARIGTNTLCSRAALDVPVPEKEKPKKRSKGGGKLKPSAPLQNE
jgi:hypothetical protein